ncbi:MAG: magnesium transporter CorA family protein [Polaromonas sp.]|nr:magnesium transporter CorA family protein [Polaromonas sp.]
MQIIEFTGDSLRFADAVPAQSSADSFVWVFLDREDFETHRQSLQQAAQSLGGSAMLDLHCKDLASAVHPSHYDYTSIYDLIIFRRLATQLEIKLETDHGDATNTHQSHAPRASKKRPLDAPDFNRISSKPVGFVVFDRLLISVHDRGCYAAKSFVERFLADAKFSADTTAARNRIPTSPADLVLRMINVMVDSYLDVRKQLATQLGSLQAELLKPESRKINWGLLMGARSQLHVLEDLCDEQHDAMQEWLDSLREQPVASFSPNAQTAQALRDQLIARARDIIEHIERVVHHARRLEQSAETVVQIYFSAQSNRTNDIMRTLTALTAIFLPLNLITGFFGMNFEFLPLIHHPTAFWWTFGAMLLLVALVVAVFWRKQYLARESR